MITRYGIWTGDANEKMGKVRDESIDFILTSPPYDNVRDYQDGNSFCFPELAEDCYRVLKPGGTLVWIVGDQTKNGSESGTSFRQALFFRDECGFNLHDTMIYYKRQAPLTHRRYEQCFEYMFVLTKGRPKTFNPIRVMKSHPETKPRVKGYAKNADGSRDMGTYKIDVPDRIADNVWRITKFWHTKEKRFIHQHPAIFAEELAEKHIHTWSNPGDWILDPFLGSGTTMEVGVKMGRNVIGIEKSPYYSTIARQRMQLFKRANEKNCEGQRA